MKKKLIIVLTLLLLMLTAVGGVYVGYAYKFADNFGYGLNTYINGMNVTGYDAETVNDILLKKIDLKQLKIVDPDGKTYKVPTTDIDLSVDYLESLNRIMASQDPFKWPVYYFNQQNYKVEPVVTFDEEKLLSNVDKCLIYSGDVYDIHNTIEIVKTADKGYVIKDHTQNLICKDLVNERILEGVYNLEDTIELDKDTYYKSLIVSTEMRNNVAIYDKINRVQNYTYTYLIRDKEVVVGPGQIANWILTDEDGKFVSDSDGKYSLDEKKAEEGIKEILRQYETINITRHFMSTRGDEITFEGGLYGDDIDEDLEAKEFLDKYNHNITGVKREPVYKCQARGDGYDDLGGTYIEVDMSAQKLYYYEDNKLKLETDVVTGNIARRTGTPAKICYIYYMQRNRTLRGPGYASFVYYWMAVNGNIGLHDATWRRRFGGDEYKYNGSHGCVNMPKSKAGELYNMVEVGTPVVMFY